MLTTRWNRRHQEDTRDDDVAATVVVSRMDMLCTVAWSSTATTKPWFTAGTPLT